MHSAGGIRRRRRLEAGGELMNRRVKLLVTVGSAVFSWLATVVPSAALYLDDARNFKITGSFYTQTRIRMQDSDPPLGLRGAGTNPKVHIGDPIQWRNYANPVLEGDLTKSLGLPWIDDLSFRFAGRFIYDGIYDFGADQFRSALRRSKVSAASASPNGLDPNPGPGLGGNEPVAVYQGTKPVEDNNGGLGPCGSSPPFFAPDCEIADPNARAARLRDQEVFDPRNEFAQHTDPWEIYMNIQKGPLFVRVGRQSLAWGESDGQRLLDGINPLDRLFGLPFDEDIDEQRIPLWMLRTNLQLIDTWGPLSSFGLESFWVPGVIDTTQNPIPFGANYPYGPPSGCDPQFIANEDGKANTGGTSHDTEGCVRTDGGALPAGTVKTSLYERLPAKRLEHSRYGARVLGILFRDYTFSLGYYKSWADAPQPRVHFTDILRAVPPPGPESHPPFPTAVIAELTHGQVDVIGGSLSFFQPYLLPGVVRSEAGYFMGEPALVPIANLGNIPTVPDQLAGQGIFLDTFVPDADYIRWVLGYDMYQLNFPWLSQTNNIIVVAQWFNSLRISGNGPFEKLAAEIGVPADFGKFDFGLSEPTAHGQEGRISAPKYQSLGNITFQAFTMHGLLVPRITFVGDIEGWGSVLPGFEYRLRDDLLIRFNYSTIFGNFFGGGIFRDRDQIGARLTYLLS